MKKLLPLFLLLTASLAFAGGKSDKWIESAEQEYPSDKFITGIGTGPTRSTAESAAKLSLCQQLGESIDGQQNATVSATTKTVDGSLDVKVTEKILYEKVTGIQIKNTAVKNNVTYALAVLDRKEAGDFYYNKAKENETVIMQLLSAAKDEQDALKKCGKIQKAISLAKENEYNLELLSVINKTKYRMTSMSYRNTENIQNYYDETARSVTFAFETKGEHITAVETGLLQTLNGLGFSTTKDAAKAQFVISSETTVSTSSDDKYVFERYNLVSTVTGTYSNSTFNMTLTGREGQTDATKASQRVDLKLPDRIKEEFTNKLYDYMGM